MSTWHWPVPGYTEISSPFGPRIPPEEGASSNHKGIDIPAPKGTPIVAACDGTVTHSGKAPPGYTAYGKWVRIDHGGGVVSVYGHISEAIAAVGAVVKAGETIAKVGSEGISSGNHLHFRIDVNNVAKNPVNYVSTTGPKVVSDPIAIVSKASIPSWSSLLGITPIYSNYTLSSATGTTIGQRVSGLTTQPAHAFVNIYVGDDLKLLSTDPAKPNILQSFEYKRLQDAGESASFVLFDDNWEEIEKVLSQNFDRVYIEYGYYGTGLRSKLIKHRLQEYAISFTPTGSILSIQSATEGVYDNLKPMTSALNTYNPTEAVKKICKNLGYTVLDENFDTSHDISSDNPFNMIAEYPITYIQNIIIPQSSRENEELFSFYIDSNNVAYFKRDNVNTSNTEGFRTYIYQKGYDSPIISLEFDMKGTFGGQGDLDIVTEYKNTAFDEDKSQVSQTVNKSSAITIATGDSTHTRSDQSSKIIGASGYTPSQMKSKMYYYMKTPRYDAYKATMTIVGDPSIELYKDIRIINVTDKGYLHHTSGLYHVIGITDSISGGIMTTSLELSRNAAYNLDGLEIINPKLILK